MGALRCIQAVFNLIVFFVIFSVAVRYGAEANLVDEKIRDELVAIKKKLDIMNILSYTRKVYTRKQEKYHYCPMTGGIMGKVYIFKKINVKEGLAKILVGS